MSRLKTLYIVGPTASGKTALAVRLALKLGAEIVCADSQTLRRGMDIGTAKPTAAERRGVPHYMLDIIDPYDEYSLHQYLNAARDIIRDIHKRNKLAIVIGGTGLYIDALLFNYDLPSIQTAQDVDGLTVEELQQKVAQKGLSLPSNDKNPRHLINVLKREGASGGKTEPDPGSRIVGIAPPRELLISRINERVDVMFELGFMDEVRGIVERFGRPPRSFDAIGYKIAMRVLDNEIDEDEAKELFKIADRQYAKRQMSWLKRNSYIEWYESADDVDL